MSYAGSRHLSSTGAIERRRDEKPSDPAYFDFSMLRNSAECASEIGWGDQVKEAQWQNQIKDLSRCKKLLVSSLR